MGDLDLKAYLAEEAEKDRRGDALKASMRRGMSRNPDEYAKALALAAQTGKAPEFVEQFRPEIEVEQALTSIEGLVMSHPKSAEWLANEQHASLAHDDLGSLRRLEEEVTSATSSLLKGVVSRGQQVVQGGLEVGELAAGTVHDLISPLLPGGSVDQAGRRLQERWSKPIGMGQSTAPMTTAFQARRQQTNQYFGETIKAAAPVTKADGSMDWGALNPVTNPRFYANLVLEEGPMLAVQMAAGWRVYNAAVSNGASQAQATRLAAQVSARLEGTQIGAAEYVEAREKGMDPATAVLSASSKATLSVMVSSGIPGAKAWAARLEEQGVKGLRRRVAGIAAEGTEGLFFREAAKAGAMGGIRGRATRALLGSMTEGLEELGQEEISMGVDRLYDANAYQGAAGRRVTSFIGGAVLGGPMGALVGGPSTAAQEQALPGGQRGLQALSEVAATSKLAQRSPEKFAEFVGNLTAGTEQETVRMDARVFFQDLEAKGLDPMAVAQEMGAKNLEEALAAGTDLLVPTATYARALAESPGLAEVVTPIAKFRAQDMTAREMEAFTQEAMAEFEAQAQGEAGQVAAEMAPDQALVQIREAIRSQLVEVGFEATTADTNAMAMAKMVYTLATREGLDPLEYFQSWGVQTERAGFGEGTERINAILAQLQKTADPMETEGPTDAEGDAPLAWGDEMLFQGPVDQPELQAGAEELGPIRQALQALGIDPAQVASGADLLAQVRQVVQARPEVAEVARDLGRMLFGVGPLDHGPNGGDVLGEKKRKYDPSEAYTHDIFGAPLRHDGGGVSGAKGGDPGDPGVPGEDGAIGGDDLFRNDTPPGVYATRTEALESGLRRIGIERVTSVEDAATALAYLGGNTVEHFDALVVDSEGKPLAVVGAFKGDHTSTVAPLSPVLQEVSRVKGASAVWFGHNHPSGSLEFSGEDRNLWSRFENAMRGSGIEPKGLFAIGGGAQEKKGWAFLGPDGAKSGEAEPHRGPVLPIVDRAFVEHGHLGAVTSPREAKVVASKIGGPGVMWLGNGKVVGFTPINKDSIATLRGSGQMDELWRGSSMANARQAIILADPSIPQDAVANLARFLNASNLDVADVLVSTGGPDGQDWDSWLAEGRNFKGTTFFQSAYHGSPYRFDRFSLEHMGKGEGAQAYGWGLYFAGSKEVAEWYRAKLAAKDAEVIFTGKSGLKQTIGQNGREGIAARFVAAFEGDIDAALEELKRGVAVFVNDDSMRQAYDWLVRNRDRLEYRQKDTGQTYKVEIPDDGSYLLWDKPLSEQPETVKKWVDSLPHKETPGGTKIKFPNGEELFSSSDPNGSTLYAMLTEADPSMGQEGASKFLRDIGVPGIKYLDGSEGSYNYVIFDDSAVKVLETYYQDIKNDWFFGSRDWNEFYLGGKRWLDGGLEKRKRARALARRLKTKKGQREMDDANMEAFQAEEEEYRQWEESIKALQAADTLQSKAGFIALGNRNRVSIALLEHANLSTFFHEFGGHLGLAMLEDLATREGASEQVKADWKAALDYLGVASGEDIQVEHHEKWARSMEAYLMEGKAPSEDLKGAFARIKEWMKLVYRQLTALGVKLTPEVRGVFDRMFASDAEIEAARADLGETQALFATPEDMGVTPAEFALYSEARAKEIEAAKTMLELRLLKELERERKDVWQAERDEVEAEIRAQLEQQPVYQAFDILAKGEMPDGTPLKLNKGDLEAQIGKGEAKKLPRRFNRIYTRDGGVDLDTAAEFLGFESGGALFDALVEMEPLKAVAARLAEEEMHRRHGNMMLDGTITDAAQEALHNSHREEALALELQALRRLEREVRPFVAQARKEQRQAEREDRRQAREALKAIPPMETFRTSAREIVEGQRIRDLEPHRYLLAQRKHAREAFKAMKKRDYQAAADAKQKELLSHFLYLEALKAKEEADKIARYARKAEKTSFQAMLGKAGEEFQAQFNAMLDRYEFRAVTLKELDARSQNLAKFAEAQVANGEVIDFDPDLYLEQPKNYREMTLPELRAVKDALKNIETIARRQLEFVVAGKKMTREEIREAFTGWTPPEERTPVHLEGDRLRWTEKVGRAVRGLDAELLKVEWMVDRFDRGDINGPMRTYLKSLVDDADGRRQEMAFQMFKKIEALAKARDPQQVKRGDQLTKIRFPKRATPLTYDQLIAWALNLGTAENQKVAFLGEGLILGDGSLSPVVDQALSEIHSSDWAFIQGVWDALEELRAPLAAEHRRKTGLEMGLKELTPFSVTSSDGVKIDLRGGYYPLAASSVTNVGQTQADPLNTAGRGRNSRARVNTGMTKQVTGATYQLKLDYATVLSKHLHQTITNITFGETVEAVNWILGDEAIRNALSEKLGPEYVATLQGWVKDTIENPDDAPEQGAMIRGITRFKSGATIATLAGSIPSLAVQLSDWAKPIFAPGIRNGDLLKARYDLSLNYREIVEDIHRLSPNVMRHRAENFHRELRDLLQARNAFEGKNQATARFLMQAFSIMDAQVTLPAWLAVYRRGLQEHGIEAQAVAEADRFVSRTFQAGGPRDMSKLFRSRDGWARLFTTFQNDGNTWYGIISSAVASKKIGRISMALMGAFIGQALGQILKNRGWGDDDDEEGKKKWVVQQALLTGINSLPVVGSVMDGALGVTGYGGGGDYTTSAMVRTAKAFAKPFMKFEDMDWEEIAMAEAEAAGYAFGVPLTAQMIRTWKYAHKVRQGEARPDGPADAAVDAVFGQNPREKR
jgi:hypothetical protein